MWTGSSGIWRASARYISGSQQPNHAVLKTKQKTKKYKPSQRVHWESSHNHWSWGKKTAESFWVLITLPWNGCVRNSTSTQGPSRSSNETCACLSAQIYSAGRCWGPVMHNQCSWSLGSRTTRVRSTQGRVLNTFCWQLSVSYFFLYVWQWVSVATRLHSNSVYDIICGDSWKSLDFLRSILFWI